MAISSLEISESIAREKSKDFSPQIIVIPLTYVNSQGEGGFSIWGAVPIQHTHMHTMEKTRRLIIKSFKDSG